MGHLVYEIGANINDIANGTCMGEVFRIWGLTFLSPFLPPLRPLALKVGPLPSLLRGR